MSYAAPCETLGQCPVGFDDSEQGKAFCELSVRLSNIRGGTSSVEDGCPGYKVACLLEGMSVDRTSPSEIGRIVFGLTTEQVAEGVTNAA